MSHRFRILLSFIPFLLLSACAASTTQIVSATKMPEQKRGMHSVLVVGIAGSLENRQRFENEFAQKLSAYGVTPYPSYALFASSGIPSKNELETAMRQRGIDTILITRFIDKKETITYLPGTMDYPVAPHADDEYYGYLQYGYGYVTTPGYTFQNKSVVLRTNLYDASSGKLSWTATTNTTTQADNADIVKSFIGAITKKMKKDGLM